MFLLNQDKLNYVFKNAAPIQRMSLRPPLTSLGKQTCSPWHHMKKKRLVRNGFKRNNLQVESSPWDILDWQKEDKKYSHPRQKTRSWHVSAFAQSSTDPACYHFKVNHIPKMALNIRTWFKCHMASSCLFTRCGGIESQMCLLWTEHATSIVLY